MLPAQGFVPHAKPDDDLMHEIKEIFQIYDDNRSGTLDFDEFTHALALIGAWCPELRPSYNIKLLWQLLCVLCSCTHEMFMFEKILNRGSLSCTLHAWAALLPHG